MEDILSPELSWISPDSLHDWRRFTYPGINQQIPVPDMTYELCPGIDELLVENGPLGDVQISLSNVISYLDTVSAALANTDNKIVFRATSAAQQGRTRRPDFVAHKEHLSTPQVIGDVSWSHIEAAIQLYPSSKIKCHPEAQLAAFTAYYLKARPDRISASGLWVVKDSFIVVYTGATMIYHTERIPFDDDEATRLIYAFVWSLYYPKADPTLAINPKSTFTVTVSSDEAYYDLTVLHAGSTVGRRTVILASSRDPDLVIKEQYIRCGKKLIEAEILTKIHAEGGFPGIVRLRSYEQVNVDGQFVATSNNVDARDKWRLILEGKGRPFAELSTIREMLMVIYDVLEVIRILYRKRKVLHGDISPGNILFRELHVPEQGVAPDIEDICFCHSLLDLGEHTRSSPYERLCTSVLLTDFDCGHDMESLLPEDRTAGTGTTAFMAIAVRNSGTRPAVDEIPPIPTIHDELLPRYQQLLPERLQRFPGNESEIIKAKAITYEPDFEHNLRYDVESVFWCMVWWLLPAKPEGTWGDALRCKAWQNLIGSEDSRYDSYIAPHKRFPLHPTYAPLSGLLECMADHLRINLDLSNDEIKRDEPEYLCEVFQRLVLNFLVEHRAAEFLRVAKDVQWREITDTFLVWNQKRCSTTTSSHTTKRTREQRDSIKENEPQSKKARVE